MTASENCRTPSQIEAVLRAFEDGATATAAGFWTEEGVFIDPQCPDSEYSGPAGIRHHRMHDGTEVDFPQVFIVEGDDGRITRWQSYLPFPPPSSG